MSAASARDPDRPGEGKIIAFGQVPPGHGVRSLVPESLREHDQLYAIFLDGIFAGVVDERGSCAFASFGFSDAAVRSLAAARAETPGL